MGDAFALSRREAQANGTGERTGAVRRTLLDATALCFVFRRARMLGMLLAEFKERAIRWERASRSSSIARETTWSGFIISRTSMGGFRARSRSTRSGNSIL